MGEWQKVWGSLTMCPHCGYCQHCGRSHGNYIAPWGGYPQIYWQGYQQNMGINLHPNYQSTTGLLGNAGLGAMGGGNCDHS